MNKSPEKKKFKFLIVFAVLYQLAFVLLMIFSGATKPVKKIHKKKKKEKA